MALALRSLAGWYAQTNASAMNSENPAEMTSTLELANPVLSEQKQFLIEMARRTEARDIQGNIVENALNFNLGMQITPIPGQRLKQEFGNKK